MSSNYCNVQLHQDLHLLMSMLSNLQDQIVAINVLIKTLQLPNQAQNGQTEGKAKAEIGVQMELFDLSEYNGSNGGKSKI